MVVWAAEKVAPALAGLLAGIHAALAVLDSADVKPGEISKLALWDVDLALSTGEEDIDSTLNSLAVRSWEEDVADGIAILEWSVSHLDFLVVTLVSEGDEEFTAGEGVEVVLDVSLNEVLIPDFTGLTLGMDLSDLLVKIRAGVHVLPERLTVLGIVSAGIVLLRSVVCEGDTT